MLPAVTEDKKKVLCVLCHYGKVTYLSPATALTFVRLASVNGRAVIFQVLWRLSLVRKVPDFPQALRSQALLSTTKASSYTIKVITPLFGGGVEPGENDEITPIRVPSIRGQLRFWWRATRGAQFETPAQLAEAEGKIWGTTSDSSRVQLTVTINNRDERRSCESLVRRGHLGYALFPFRENESFARYIPPIQFTLNIRCPTEMADDTRTAVWAWVNFGGLGARTRRGCGALLCSELAPTSAAQISAWLKSYKTAFKLSEYPLRPWPTLGSLYVNQRPKTLEDAWEMAVELLHRFRQGEIGRRETRTCWPEAASIRSIRRDPDRKLHSAFPRAGLGLPIVFQFKNEPDLGMLELSPEASTRMSSPLILRPLALSQGSAVPMIMCLRAQGPVALKLTLLRKASNEKLLSFSSTEFISRPDLATYRNSPMKGRSSEGSALIAFLALAKEEGFKEIS